MSAQEDLVLSRRSPTSAPLVFLVAVLAAGLALPGSAFAAVQPAPLAPPVEGSQAPGDFSMNLYRNGDHVPQYTPYWCIGASMQMMLNIVGVTDDESRKAQERYMRAARSGGRSPLSDDDVGDTESAGELRGAGSRGWARGLVALGAGGYYEGAADGYTAALRGAAKAIRSTGRPVGMIVWRGKHAWVMTGFTATADPLVDRKFRVTGVYVQDPWYPRVSSIWGPGQRPNKWLSVKALRSDFLPRSRGWRRPELAGKFVLVLPVTPVRPAVRSGRMV
jgi:hypothetical protein